MYNRPWAMAKKNLGYLLTALHSCGKEAVNGGVGMGGEATVDDETVRCLRQVHGAVGQVQGRMLSEMGLDHSLIFLRFERTGGIDQDAVGGKECGAVLKDIQLLLPIAEQILRTAVPADVGMSAGYPGAGTGRVDEDTVEGRQVTKDKMLESALMDNRR